jgi:GDPmannose 4,6-dehydratase
MKAIIFGINGQDGYYLNELLKKEGLDVVGISRQDAIANTDIADFSQVSELIQGTKPDYVFHFAANSTTHHESLFQNENTISRGTINILEAVRLYSQKSKVFISGSGLQFRNAGKPIKESDDFEAHDAYSVARIHSVFAARYFRSFGLKIYVGYFFNHDSPRRSERHITKKISEAAKRIANGSKEKISIGDISVIKEYTYAGDIVRAVWTLVSQDKIFEVNLGSGKGYSIENWLKACFELAGKDWRQYVDIKEGFVAEYSQLVCDPSLIQSLGWKPEVTFTDLAKMMMD